MPRRAIPASPQLPSCTRSRPTDPAAVTALAARTAADLVVIGPEAPLVAGVGDAVRAAGLRCFGPDRAAAMIEGSKSFAKEIMIAAGIPTAAARSCRTEAEVSDGARRVRAALRGQGGRPGGRQGRRGHDRPPGRRAHARQIRGQVVIEEFLDGPEVSVFALADGITAVPLLPAQDFKRADDGDTGPNTGGMGAYAPLPWAPPDLAERTSPRSSTPALAELRRRGTPYRGLLYAGLALTRAGIKVIEFNARFGDPETQVVLDRLATPLAGLLAAAADGDLASGRPAGWSGGAAVTVVIAAEGYPGTPVTGDRIDGMEEAEQIPGAYVLHAGTVVRDGDSGQRRAAGC